MESDKFSSKYNKSGLKKSKPSFKLIEKCKIIVEQSQDWGSDLSGDYTFILDLSKQEFISTFPFTIKDRNGIASIHVIEMREDKEISNKYKTDAYFGVTINGEYKQKIIKATANLSRICHEKF